MGTLAHSTHPHFSEQKKPRKKQPQYFRRHLDFTHEHGCGGAIGCDSNKASRCSLRVILSPENALLFFDKQNFLAWSRSSMFYLLFLHLLHLQMFGLQNSEDEKQSQYSFKHLEFLQLQTRFFSAAFTAVALVWVGTSAILDALFLFFLNIRSTW